MLYYTATDQAMIAQADLFAATKHACQQRKDGTPYIHHPRYVSVLAGYWAQSYFYEPEPADDKTFSRLGIIRVAALCHDLMEDQDVHYETIYLLFGEKVAEYVAQLSINKTITDNVLRNEAYCQVLREAGVDVQLIKLADIYHNAVSATPNAKFGSKWAKKAYLMLEALNKIPRSCSYYMQTLDAIKVREVCSHGTNISREGMGSNAYSTSKEEGTAGNAAEKQDATCV